MSKVIKSNQGTIHKSGDIYEKIFHNINDYTQEKYFYEIVQKAIPNTIPNSIVFDDAKMSIKMESAGVTLDEKFDITKDGDELVCLIIQELLPLWNYEIEIEEKYTFTDSKLLNYVSSFLEKCYYLVLKPLHLSDELINLCVLKMKSTMQCSFINKGLQPNIIHFDLSPRNILIKEGQIKIIDWSRAIKSYLLIEVALLFEKFELNSKCTPRYSLVELEKLKLNIQDVNNIANCFHIYRAAKRAENMQQLELLNSFIHNFVR